MASSKTSQGEDKWGKHGMQMCLMRLKREQLIVQNANLSSTMESIKERVPTRGSTEYARLKQTGSSQKLYTETKIVMTLVDHRAFESLFPAHLPRRIQITGCLIKDGPCQSWRLRNKLVSL